MGMPCPKIPWAAVAKKRASTHNLWTYRNPNRLVVVNPDIARDENNELRILVISFLEQVIEFKSYFIFGRYLHGAVPVLCKCILASPRRLLI